MFHHSFGNAAHGRMARAARHRKFLPTLELLEGRALPSTLGDIFYIEMENHNLTQPPGTNGPEQLLGNPAAPYLNSLMTPGNPNARHTSFTSNYLNAGQGIHPSEPNYVWQEAGLTGPLNDNDPFPNNIVDAPNLSGLLQAARIPWRSYQEDVDLIPNSGSVNQPGPNSLTNVVAPRKERTVPLISFSGTSTDYVNPYNNSHQYNFATKHDGQLFFTATNGGDDRTHANRETKYYAPLQQLQRDLENDTVARYNLITPNQYNDMHSGLNAGFTYHHTHYTGDEAAIAQGDNFLSIIVPQILESKAYKHNGAIVIWYDETEGGDTSDYTLPLIVISRQAKGNAYESTLTYTHSSDLKSMEELFGVYAPDGSFLGDANTAGTNDLSDLFKPGALTQPTQDGTDLVDLQSVGSFKLGDPGASGLTGTLTGISGEIYQTVNLTTATSYNGAQSFTELLPGTNAVAISSAASLHNDFTTPTGTIDDIALGLDQIFGALDSGFLVAGYSGHHQNG
jgi:hypothetical protein